MALEEKAFLQAMPEGLQKKQENAVRRAISGDNRLLQQIRASRNMSVSLPAGVDTVELDGIYRLYRPESRRGEYLPLLIYLHGGGWCFGSLNSCARFCSELALHAGIAVLAVDYPLAPEFPYPVALESCVEAVRFAHANAERYGFRHDSISIGGDSAGGNLALAVSLKMSAVRNNPAADTVANLNSLVLFYPVTKVWNDSSASWNDFRNGYGLDGSLMDAFNEAYLCGHDACTPLISPACAPDSMLASIPRTLIVNASHDILRDQGRELFDRLNACGVECGRYELPGTSHLFITVAGQAEAFSESVRLTSDFLRGSKSCHPDSLR
ncbi:MAG: alpha/beta hydrolase [Muribaculaceae bacterium]|nr:alpha/beta hydrolase [Muribaculaceae bacterium]